THLAFLLGGVLFGLHLLSSAHAVKEMRHWKYEQLGGKAGLLFVDIVPEPSLTKLVYPFAPALGDSARELDRHGFLTPHLVRSNLIEEIQGQSRLSPGSYGRLATLTRMNARTYVATGWAALPDRKEPAHAVVLTWECADGHPRIFALAGLAHDNGESGSGGSTGLSVSGTGWRKAFSGLSLPLQHFRVRAWAFDSLSGEDVPLEGTFRLPQRSRPQPLALGEAQKGGRAGPVRPSVASGRWPEEKPRRAARRAPGVWLPTQRGASTLRSPIREGGR